MDVVETMEARYLRLLNQAAARLGKKHPTFKINVGSGSVGAATPFQGHVIYLEAFRLHSADPETNCLTLEICLRDLTGLRTLCTLGVAWGGDGIAPRNGLDLLSAEVAFGSEALRIIDDALPRLEAHFERSLNDWEAAYPKST